MFITVLSIYRPATGVISCGGWMRFWLAVFAAVRDVKTRTAILRASLYGAPKRSLEPLDLTKIFDIVRFAGPVLASVLLASSLAYAQNGAPAPRPEEDFSFMKMLADKGLHDIDNEAGMRTDSSPIFRAGNRPSMRLIPT
jgi:hypothetical protein